MSCYFFNILLWKNLSWIAKLKELYRTLIYSSPRFCHQHFTSILLNLLYHLFVSNNSVIVTTAAVANDFWGLSMLLLPFCLSQQPFAFLLVIAPQFSPELTLSLSQLSRPKGTHLNLGMCPSLTPGQSDLSTLLTIVIGSEWSTWLKLNQRKSS